MGIWLESLHAVIMALLLTYFCSTSSRKKTVSFLSCLMPRVCPAHKPRQANISTRKMALDVYETQEGTYAGTCCRRTTRTSTRRDITGREHVLRGRSALLGLQRESRGDRPTDVTGSPRSLQKPLVFSGAGAPCPPIRRAPELFFATLLPPQKIPAPVQTGLPRAFEWY